MFEIIRIKLLGIQPVARVTDKLFEHLVQREFGNRASEVKHKLQQVRSDSQNGKNRISAAILKLSNKDFSAIDYYIKMGAQDFRDVISKAEYPRCAAFGFGKIERQDKKRVYLEDWIEYSKWLNK